LQNAKIWSDELATGGKPMGDEDLVSFIVNGINPSFNSFISHILLPPERINFLLKIFTQNFLVIKCYSISSKLMLLIPLRLLFSLKKGQTVIFSLQTGEMLNIPTLFFFFQNLVST
jgi:hypothetical protein